MGISIRDLRLTYHSYQNYYVDFNDDTITTLVTHNSSIVDIWISDMKNLHNHSLPNLVIGLDIEWLPYFYNSSNNKVATLQLCIGHDCLIFQLKIASKIPESLYQFLGDDDYTFVGVGIRNDVEKLESDYGLFVKNPVDLRYIAASEYGDNNLRGVGLVKLSKEVLGRGFDKPKRVTISNWEVDRLSDDQIMYACVDAFVSYQIGTKFPCSIWNKKSGAHLGSMEISFSEADSDHVVIPRDSALVLTLPIGNCMVHRVLVHNGSSANIMYYEAFKTMKLQKEDMKPVRIALVDYLGGSVVPLGSITLPIVFGEGKARVKRSSEFLVVDEPSVYNVILGRPILMEIGAVVSCYDQKVKFPTPHGVGEVRGDQQAPRQCYTASVFGNFIKDLSD